MSTRPTWAEISLTAIQHNFSTVKAFVTPEATVCAVVKADAYGHGAEECARAMQAEGAKWFGVTSTDEGISLRKAGITGRILLLSGFWHGEEEAVLEHNLTPAIWEWGHIELLENAAEKMDKAQQSVAVHLKVETGMGRLGVNMQELPQILQALTETNFVMLEGFFSHFASAEVTDAPDVDAQLERFDQAVEMVLARGLSPIYYHMANSAGIVTQQRSWKNMVRPGISLYGYYLPLVSALTGAPDSSLELPIKPALSWKSRVIAIRDVDAGQPIGYNGSFVTQSPSRLAVIPVGYADGLSRDLSNRGQVIVRNDFARMVGNISMDLTILDVTGMPGVDVGDEVILIGESASRKITASDMAAHSQTIAYEVLCAISKRVRRVYVE
jgi:alanine racemase